MIEVMSEREKKDYDTMQHVIRTAIEGLTDEKKGRLTTQGVISFLQDTIQYLQTRAMKSSPENYLDEE